MKLSLVKKACVTRVSELILSSVSNWGGYGLVASLSKLSGKNLMPTVHEDMDLIKKTVDLGAVDGMSNSQEYKVDGFTLEENAEMHYQAASLDELDPMRPHEVEQFFIPILPPHFKGGGPLPLSLPGLRGTLIASP